MQLVPFDPRCAEQVQPYYCDPAYSHWARGVIRFLTLEECSRLPDILRSEILMVVHEDQMIGLTRFREEVPGTFNVSLILNKDLHGKKLAQPCMDLIEDYVIKVRGGRMVVAEFLVKDYWLGDGVLKRGWTKSGEIPSYVFCDGEFEDVCIFYKKLK